MEANKSFEAKHDSILSLVKTTLDGNRTLRSCAEIEAKIIELDSLHSWQDLLTRNDIMHSLHRIANNMRRGASRPLVTMSFDKDARGKRL